MTLPANVTPVFTNGAVATDVVSLSGTFAGGPQTPPVYTAATASALGTLKVILANPVNTGVTQVGDTQRSRFSLRKVWIQQQQVLVSMRSA